VRIGEILSCALFAVAAFGCSSSKGTSVGDAGSSSSAIVPAPPGSAGPGICEPTCPRACNIDNDCNTDLGELCCNYGSSKVCQFAENCPVFCTNDSVCQTSLGQACVVTSLTSGTQSSCDDAGAGLHFCQTDTDCGGGSQTCCTNYDRPICTDTNECPSPCAQDSQCNPDRGEICCTTVQAIEPDLSARGLCLNPAVQPCPRACTASSDCRSLSATPLCCDGFCAATCAMTCTQDSDCYDEICCKSPSLSVAVPPVLFAVSPGCSGEPADPTCGDCFLQSGACNCLGCTPVADAGSCFGGGQAPTCALCALYFNCEADECPGCSHTMTPGCSGTPSYATCAQCPSGYCSTGECPGCLLDNGFCSGTIAPCGAATTPTQCENEPGCGWNATACVGTITPCDSFTTEASCEAEEGCGWGIEPEAACVGTPTPCGQLSIVPARDGGVSACNLQVGCLDPSTTSDVTPIPDGGFTLTGSTIQ
jgi:hypothetical protein